MTIETPFQTTAPGPELVHLLGVTARAWGLSVPMSSHEFQVLPNLEPQALELMLAKANQTSLLTDLL